MGKESRKKKRKRRAAEKVYKKYGLAPPWQRSPEERKKDDKIFGEILDAWCKKRGSNLAN